ncbi:hypothetical protein AX16_008689, partial [Volvariella volvacea WC 439]
IDSEDAEEIEATISALLHLLLLLRDPSRAATTEIDHLSLVYNFQELTIIGKSVTGEDALVYHVHNIVSGAADFVHFSDCLFPRMESIGIAIRSVYIKNNATYELLLALRSSSISVLRINCFAEFTKFLSLSLQEAGEPECADGSCDCESRLELCLPALKIIIVDKISWETELFGISERLEILLNWLGKRKESYKGVEALILRFWGRACREEDLNRLRHVVPSFTVEERIWRSG